MTTKNQKITVIDGNNQDLEKQLSTVFFGDSQLEVIRLLELLEKRKLTTPVLAVDNSKTHSYATR